MFKAIMGVLELIQGLILAYHIIRKQQEMERLKNEIRKKNDDLTRSELERLLR